MPTEKKLKPQSYLLKILDVEHLITWTIFCFLFLLRNKKIWIKQIKQADEEKRYYCERIQLIIEISIFKKAMLIIFIVKGNA